MAMITASPGHQLAVAVADPGGAGRRLGRVAVPPRRVDQPAARHLDHGHADLAGHPGRARLVGLRAVLGHGRHAGHDPPVPVHHRTHRRRGQHLPGGRRRGDHVHPGRSLLRGALQATGGRCAPGTARARRQGGGGAPRRVPTGRSRSASPPTSSPRACGSWCAPARRSRPTVSSRRGPPQSTPRCSPVSPCRSRWDPAMPWSGATVNAGGRLVVRATRVGSRHPARPDGAAGRGRPERQGPGATPGRSDLGHLRPDRDRAGRRHARLLDRHRWRALGCRSPQPSRC